MAVPGSTDPVKPSGLYYSIRSFASVLVSILETRLDLATLELEHEAWRALRLVALVLSAVLALFASFFFFMFFLLALIWDTEYRLPVLATISIVFVLIGTVLVFVVKNMVKNWPRMFSQTLAELRKDADQLKSLIEKKAPASTPTSTP